MCVNLFISTATFRKFLSLLSSSWNVELLSLYTILRALSWSMLGGNNWIMIEWKFSLLFVICFHPYILKYEPGHATLGYTFYIDWTHVHQNVVYYQFWSQVTQIQLSDSMVSLLISIRSFSLLLTNRWHLLSLAFISFTLNQCKISDVSNSNVFNNSSILYSVAYAVVSSA